MLSFSHYRLDLEAERLWKDETELRLRRKPFAILRYLVRHPQRLVTHAEIVEAVWGKVAMSESLLRTHVHDLRKVLGEELVETVAGRGYRFLATVTNLDFDERWAPAELTGHPADNPFVGREVELDVLRTALRAARAQRRATVFVVGDAGVGKTALVDALLDEASTQGALLVGRGACVEQYGHGEVYLPLLDAVGMLCAGRAGKHVIEVFAQHAPSWLLHMSSLVAPERLDELQRRASGAAQGRTMRELAAALEVLSREAPLVLVLEDLHWTDPSTAEFLSVLAGRRDPARILLLGTYREAEVHRGHPLARVTSELIAHRQASRLWLEGLPDDAVTQYLSRRFPGHTFPAKLAGALVDTTGGNALFVTTLVDDLEQRGLIVSLDGHAALSTSVDDVAARRPDSIRRLIDTQIDRLSPLEQRIVEVAAVAGLTFTVGMVAHALDEEVDIVDTACESLATSRRLLTFVGVETWSDCTIQVRYAFGHSLVQHAARMRSAAATARSVHQKLGERLESGHASRTEHVSAELAMHFERAQLPLKAARYYTAAGDAASLRNGVREAMQHYTRVRSLVEHLPGSPERDGLEMRATRRLGWKMFQADGATDAALPLLERSLELATRLDDKAYLAEVLVALQSLLLVRGELRRASEQFAVITPALDHATEPSVRRRTLQLELVAVLQRGELVEALRMVEALGLDPRSERLDAPPGRPLVLAMSHGAFALWLAGRPDDALALVRRGYEAAETLDRLWERAALLSDWATVHAWRREPAEVLELARRVQALSSQGDFGIWQSRADLLAGWAEVELAAPSAEQAEARASRPFQGVSFGRTLPALLQAQMCARLGRTERARDVVSAALAFVKQSDERWLEAELHRLHGELSYANDAATAERSFLCALDIARAQAAVSLELRAALSLHRLPGAMAKRRARDAVAEALSRMHGGEGTADVRDARRIVGTG